MSLISGNLDTSMFKLILFCGEIMPDWEKLHPDSERLASLGIMVAQLMASLKPLNTIVLWWSKTFQRDPKVGPRDTERCQSLGNLWVWSLLFFYSRITDEIWGTFQKKLQIDRFDCWYRSRFKNWNRLIIICLAGGSGWTTKKQSGAKDARITIRSGNGIS